jgi:putative transposase
MKRVAGRQTRFVNRLEGRSGTLWEGRFKSSPIDSDRYLLACCRYVEMNPVVAGLCGDPCDYPWSSCRSKLAEKEYRWLDYDPFYLGLGSCEKERQRNYLDFLAGSVSDREQDIIQKAIQRGQLTGEGAFVDEVEAKLNRRIELRGPGRPQGQKK